MESLEPKVQRRIDGLMLEMKREVKTLELNGATEAMITRQVEIFEAQIEFEIDAALNHHKENVRDNSESEDDDVDEENDDLHGLYSALDLKEKAKRAYQLAASKQAADDELQNLIEQAIEASHCEVLAIRAMGESERFVKQEEDLLEKTIDNIIFSHQQTQAIAAESSAFHGMAPVARGLSEDAVSWVEEQFARADVDDTSVALKKLIKAEAKYAEVQQHFAELMEMLTPARDEDQRATHKQERKKIRKMMKEMQKEHSREQRRLEKQAREDNDAGSTEQLEMENMKKAHRQQRLTQSFSALQQGSFIKQSTVSGEGKTITREDR